MAREPLSLDVRAKPGGLDTSGLNSQQNSAELRQPLPRDVAQFQQLMKAPEPEASQLPSGPFALFAQGALPGVQGTPHRVQTPAAAAATSDPVRDVLQGLVERLLVGDGREGRRSVRIGLTDEAMPGVDVEVFQESGAWVASFECRDPGSFERLAQPAEQMAQELAQALQSPAIWRVKPAENVPDMAQLSVVNASASWRNTGGLA